MKHQKCISWEPSSPTKWIEILSECCLRYWKKRVIEYISGENSYEIKLAPWAIWWGKILRLFFVEFAQCYVENFRFVNSKLWIVRNYLLFKDLKFSTSYQPICLNFLHSKDLESLTKLTWFHSFGWKKTRYFFKKHCNPFFTVCQAAKSWKKIGKRAMFFS